MGGTLTFLEPLERLALQMFNFHTTSYTQLTPGDAGHLLWGRASQSSGYRRQSPSFLRGKGPRYVLMVVVGRNTSLPLTLYTGAHAPRLLKWEPQYFTMPGPDWEVLIKGEGLCLALSSKMESKGKPPWIGHPISCPVSPCSHWLGVGFPFSFYGR